LIEQGGDIGKPLQPHPTAGCTVRAQISEQLSMRQSRQRTIGCHRDLLRGRVDTNPGNQMSTVNQTPVKVDYYSRADIPPHRFLLNDGIERRLIGLHPRIWLNLDVTLLRQKRAGAIKVVWMNQHVNVSPALNSDLTVREDRQRLAFNEQQLDTCGICKLA
jgi:hypothetical protein